MTGFSESCTVSQAYRPCDRVLKVWRRTPRRYARTAMVAGLAFLATAVATVFAQATARALVADARRRTRAPGPSRSRCSRWPRRRSRPASSTGWDEGTFRVFYLLGAIVNVPWLALGTVYLLVGPARRQPRCAPVLVFFTGLATGVMLVDADPRHDPDRHASRSARTTSTRCRARSPASAAASARSCSSAARSGRRSGSRAAARPGSGRARARQRADRARHAGAVERRALQGTVGHDEAFAISLAAGISVIYAGFVVASSARAPRASPSARRQLAAQQLARERARQLGDDLDARRQLVAREAAARVPQQLDRIRIARPAAARRTRRRSRRCADAVRRSPRRRRRPDDSRSPLRPRRETR